MAGGEKLQDAMAADKARPAGDQNHAHRSVLLGIAPPTLRGSEATKQSRRGYQSSVWIASSLRSLAMTEAGFGKSHRALPRKLLRDRLLHRRPLLHTRAMVGDARDRRGIDAVGFQPLRQRVEIGVGDRILFAHHPGALQHLLLDQR